MEIAPKTTKEVVIEVLGKMYDRFGFNDDTQLINQIVTVLDDPEMHEDVTHAASEIREVLWNRYSGGGASATATADLFYTLGRQNELGWLLEEAPGYRFKG